MQNVSQYNKAVKLWQSFQIETAADLEQRLDSFRVLFAYHSGKIENDEINYNDTREVFHDGRVSSFSGSTRTLFEQQNQKTCYDFLLPKIIAKQPLSVALVKEVHAILTAGIYDERQYIENGERPSEFKKHDYVTGIHEVGSTPDEVEQDMTDLLDELEEIHEASAPTPERILKAAATYMHALNTFTHLQMEMAVSGVLL